MNKEVPPLPLQCPYFTCKGVLNLSLGERENHFLVSETIEQFDNCKQQKAGSQC
jgi:hypothetical protein